MVDRAEDEAATPALDRRDSRLFLIAAVAGVGLGLYSVLADGILPGRLFVLLGNMAAPWGLVAFLVGRRTRSIRRGAAAGATTLVIGVVVYYVATAIRWDVLGGQTIAWTVVALVAGPVMGLCGAATAASPSRPPVAAVVVPSAMLVAEGLFQAYRYRAWQWDLATAKYRLAELGVILALVIAGLVLPRLLLEDRHDRHVAYLLVPAAAIAGATALVLLGRLVVQIT